MATGYYIQDHPNGPNAERIRYFGIIKMVHWELFDGPIEWYMNNPDFIVTPFEVDIKPSEEQQGQLLVQGMETCPGLTAQTKPRMNGGGSLKKQRSSKSCSRFFKTTGCKQNVV